MTIIGAIIGILVGALFSGLIIWIVGKLGLGLEVSGFGPAYIDRCDRDSGGQLAGHVAAGAGGYYDRRGAVRCHRAPDHRRGGIDGRWQYGQGPGRQRFWRRFGCGDRDRSGSLADWLGGRTVGLAVFQVFVDARGLPRAHYVSWMRWSKIFLGGLLE